MINLNNVGALIAVAIASTACGSADDPVVPAEFAGSAAENIILRITADDVRSLEGDSRLVLATQEDQVLVFDPSAGPIDFGRIDLVCPNGQQMAADIWLIERSKEQGFDVAEIISEEFSLARTMEDAYSALHGGAGPSSQPLSDGTANGACWCCSDGVCICEEFDG